MNSVTQAHLCFTLSLFLTSCVPFGTIAANSSTTQSDLISETKTETFSTETMNTVLPEDIILETGFFGGLGGFDDTCEKLDHKEPNFLQNYHGMENSIFETMEQISTDVCGLHSNETVKISVYLPDGSIRNYSLTATNSKDKNGETKGILSFLYTPILGEPFGTYRFVFSGDKWRLERTVNIIDADGPRLYRHEDKIILYKFEPFEKVRLLAYLPVSPIPPQHALVGWKEYMVDGDGRIVIIPSEDAYFVTVGEISGQVSHKHEIYDHQYDDVFCPNAPKPMALWDYEYALVSKEIIQIYNSPSEKKSREINKGEIVYLNHHVAQTCYDESWWWYVSYCEDIETCSGYVREAKGNIYYLIPLEGKHCFGLKSRLSVGDRAQISIKRDTYIRIRSEAGLDGKIIYRMPTQTLVTILEGPECADNSTWWKILTTSGYSGWMAEYQDGIYLLEPLP